MESFARSPNPLKDASAKSWTIWKEEFLIFMDLVGYTSRSSDFQANLFKNLIGSVGIEIINKLSFETPNDKNDLKKLIKKIDNYYNPEETEINKRYKFFSRCKTSDETIEHYIQALEEAAKQCNFGSLTNSLIRDVIILYTYDKKLRKKLLMKEHLTNKEIVAIYKDHYTWEKSLRNNGNREKDEKKSKETVSDKDNNIMNPCWRCRTRHPMRNCPAWNYKCSICSLMHHFEKCCRTVTKPSTSNLPNMNNLNMQDKKSQDKFTHMNK